MAGGPISPSSAVPSDASGNGRVFPWQYVGGGGNASNIEETLGVSASLTTNDPVWMLRFPMPPSIPTGTMKLRLLALANATSGTAKVTISDLNVAAGSSPSAATLDTETQVSLTWTAADVYVESKTALTPTPSGNDVMVVALTFNHSGWTLAQKSGWIPTIIWE